jgi:hypothetical protein
MMSDESFSLSLDKIGSFSSTPMVQTKGFPYVFQAQGRHRVFRHVDFPILAWLVVGIVTKLPGLQHVRVSENEGWTPRKCPMLSGEMNGNDDQPGDFLGGTTFQY